MEKDKPGKIIATGGGVAIQIEQAVHDEPGYRLYSLLKEYTPEQLDATMKFVRDLEKAEAKATREDGIPRNNPIVALIKAYNRAKAADIGKNRGKASVGIKAAICKLKHENPGAPTKQIWFKLLALAKLDEPHNEVFASDGNHYAISLEEGHLENVRIISCEAVTGKRDGVGLQQSTFNNNFRKY